MQQELEILSKFNETHFTIFETSMKQQFSEEMKDIKTDFDITLNSLVKIRDRNVRDLHHMKLVSLGLPIPPNEFDPTVFENIHTQEDLALHYEGKKCADAQLPQMLIDEFEKAKAKIQDVHKQIAKIYDIFHHDKSDRMMALFVLLWTRKGTPNL